MDEEGGYLTDTSVRVNGVSPSPSSSPSLFAGGDDPAYVGVPYTLYLSADEPGDGSISQWLVSWGDGVTGTYAGAASDAEEVQATHTFTAAATHSVGVTATDQGGSYSTDATVEVDPAPPTVAPDPTRAFCASS